MKQQWVIDFAERQALLVFMDKFVAGEDDWHSRMILVKLMKRLKKSPK